MIRYIIHQLPIHCPLTSRNHDRNLVSYLLKGANKDGSRLRKEISSLLEAKSNVNPKLWQKKLAKRLVNEYLTARLLTDYDGLVIDHDGTLIPIDRRDADLSAEIIEVLNKILAKGKYLVVMSGRGDSIWKCLDKLDKKYHCNIFHAMYNGALIVNYARRKVPIFQKLVRNQEAIVKLLRNDRMLSDANAQIVPKCYMIRIKVPSGADNIRIHVESILKTYKVTVASSGWAIDVSPSGMTKGSALQNLVGKAPELRKMKLLKIGDKGSSIGNDYQLLKKRYSFSVRDLSGSATSCFPVISENGTILYGVTATSYLLRRQFRVNDR